MKPSSQDKKNAFRSASAWLDHLLLQPHASLGELSLQKKSRLLSVFLLIFIGIFAAVDGIYLLTVPGYIPPWYGYLFLLTSFLLNRFGKYQLASTLTISMFPVVVFSNVLDGSSAQPLATLYYLLLSIILGGILLQKRVLVLLASINCIGILLMVPYAPACFPDFSAVLGPLSTMILGTFLVLVSMIHRDNLERDRQDEFQVNEQRYRTLVDGMLDGIYRSSHDGRFLDVNPAMIRMFGYASKEEMLAVDIKKEMYFSPEERESLFLDTGQEKVDIFRMRRKDGSAIWVEDHGRYVHDEHGNVIFHEGILRDITPRMVDEAEREKLIHELEAKNAELERFTYTVSHDLKAPLITITGFLGYLEEDAVVGNMERLQQDGQRIKDAVGRMKLLLDELLELSRIGRLMNPPEKAAFEDLAKGALSIVRGRLAERHTTVTIQPDLPDVFGDRQRLTEVLQNLIDNAAKFMGDQPDPHIEIGCLEKGHEQVFYVKDNGSGIDPRFHEQIFGLFNKLDPSIEGTGVGLALVKRIIEVHGGRIWVESEVGAGATFYFTIPGFLEPSQEAQT